MELCNLTPYPVDIVDENGTLIKSYPSRGVATCNTEQKLVHTIDGVPIFGKRYKPILGLPTQSVDNDKIYIVDAEVAEACRDTRFDLVTPVEPVKHVAYTYAYRQLMQV